MNMQDASRMNQAASKAAKKAHSDMEWDRKMKDEQISLAMRGILTVRTSSGGLRLASEEEYKVACREA